MQASNQNLDDFSRSSGRRETVSKGQVGQRTTKSGRGRETPTRDSAYTGATGPANAGSQSTIISCLVPSGFEENRAAAQEANLNFSKCGTGLNLAVAYTRGIFRVLLSTGQQKEM
jgi:hypothetical protein